MKNYEEMTEVEKEMLEVQKAREKNRQRWAKKSKKVQPKKDEPTDNAGQEMRKNKGAILYMNGEVSFHGIEKGFEKFKLYGDRFTVYFDPEKEVFSCTCPDRIYRGVKCKHIWAVEMFRHQMKMSSPNTFTQKTVNA